MKIDQKNKTGEITLSSGHSIVVGHKPPIVDIDKFRDEVIGKDNNTDIHSFGLFEKATPNYSTYYPDVKKEDLEPNEDEFISPVFRLLSKTIVSKGAPIDFSQGGVLKGSMPLLLGQTINIDHEIAVGNAIGAISDVFWQNSYKDRNGKVIPAGINGVLKIDGKSNPRIARGIMMDPPSIHSNSVTIRFGWEPSHQFEKAYEFYDKLGTYDKNGELIRLIVTTIKSYSETSLVSHGADPYAQKVDSSGKIINPEYASRVYSFSEGKPISGFIGIDYKGEEFSLSKDNAIPNQFNNNSNNDNQQTMKKILEELASEFGFDVEQLTEENVVDKVKAKFEDTKNDRSTELSNLKEEKTQLEKDLGEKETELTEVQGKLEKAQANESLIESFTTKSRKEAVRLYKLAKGEDVEENILNLIQESSLETANSFINQYSKEADAKFAATCNKCGSDDVSRARAKTSTDGLNGEDGNDNAGGQKTNKQIRESLMGRKKRKSLIFRGNEGDSK